MWVYLTIVVQITLVGDNDDGEVVLVLDLGRAPISESAFASRVTVGEAGTYT